MTYLLVANDGGHVAELRALAARFSDGHDRMWATARTPQTQALLAGEVVYWVDRAPTRDWKAVVSNAVLLRRLLDARPFSAVVSTGSSLALSALPQAALRRIPAHYIESVTRTDTLSMSGRILREVPMVRTYVQWPQLQTTHWHYRGSVLD